MDSRKVTATMVGNLPLSTLGIPPALSSGGGGCQVDNISVFVFGLGLGLDLCFPQSPQSPGYNGARCIFSPCSFS